MRAQRSLKQVVTADGYKAIFEQLAKLPNTVKHLIVVSAVPVVYPEVPFSEKSLRVCVCVYEMGGCLCGRGGELWGGGVFAVCFVGVQHGWVVVMVYVCGVVFLSLMFYYYALHVLYTLHTLYTRTLYTHTHSTPPPPPGDQLHQHSHIELLHTKQSIWWILQIWASRAVG